MIGRFKSEISQMIVGICLLAVGVAFGQGVEVQPGMVGREEGRLGYGWSRAECWGQDRMRWIEKSEGEVVLPGVGDGDYILSVDAMPICSAEKIQNMGAYVNGYFVKEWLMPTNGVFEVYTVQVPEKRLRRDENEIIIRGGYLHSPNGEDRDLSVAVKRIALEPVE